MVKKRGRQDMKNNILKLENIGLRRIHLKKQSAIILIAILCVLAILAPTVILATYGFCQDNHGTPSDWITSNDISGMYNLNTHKYQVSIPNSPGNIRVMGTFPTHSMLPTISDTSTVLILELEDKSQINVGDIVVFEYESLTISHRVVEKGFDSDGLYFITKGDHNCDNDMDFCGQVRPEQVMGVIVGILY